MQDADLDEAEGGGSGCNAPAQLAGVGSGLRVARGSKLDALAALGALHSPTPWLRAAGIQTTRPAWLQYEVLMKPVVRTRRDASANNVPCTLMASRHTPVSSSTRAQA